MSGQKPWYEHRREQKEMRGWVTLGDLVLRIREARGWSRPRLAELAGVSADTVASVEEAIHEPREITLECLSLALGSTPAPSVGADGAEASRSDGEGANAEDGDRERLVLRDVVLIRETFASGQGGTG